jgi:hypothetical protein
LIAGQDARFSLLDGLISSFVTIIMQKVSFFFSTKYTDLPITAFFKIRKQLNRKYKEYNYLNKNISTTSKINVKKN